MLGLNFSARSCTCVRLANLSPTLNVHRISTFTAQTSHSIWLLLFDIPLQGRRRFVELFPRFPCVLQPCQRHLLVAQGHHLSLPNTQLYWLLLMSWICRSSDSAKFAMCRTSEENSTRIRRRFGRCMSGQAHLSEPTAPPCWPHEHTPLQQLWWPGRHCGLILWWLTIPQPQWPWQGQWTVVRC